MLTLHSKWNATCRWTAANSKASWASSWKHLLAREVSTKAHWSERNDHKQRELAATPPPRRGSGLAVACSADIPAETVGAGESVGKPVV